jgi:hypothetical protein
MARTVVPGGSIQVDGLRDVQKSLQAVGADKSEIAQANIEAAQTLISRALPLVPTLSGRLRTSLRASKAMGAATAVAGNNGRLGYAAPIHWGWAIVGAQHKGTLRPGKPRNIQPQPFFSEALGYTYPEIIRNYNDNMQRLVDKHGLGEN